MSGREMASPALQRVVIYSDGSCAPNPGAGGWAAILICPELGGHCKEIAGAEPETTNNRMELLAAVRALEALRRPCDVEFHTDSQYLRSAFVRRWLKRWQANGWKSAKGEPVANQDLWRALIELERRHSVAWIWVKGHGTDSLNRRCDELAAEARRAAVAN